MRARNLALGMLGLTLACKGGAPAGGGPGAGGFALPVEVAVARQDTVVDAILATGQVDSSRAAGFACSQLRTGSCQRSAPLNSATSGPLSTSTGPACATP